MVKKGLYPIYLSVTNIEIRMDFEIKRPETDLMRKIGGDHSVVEEESYSEYFGWQFSGVGELQNGTRVHFIKRDGTATNGTNSFKATNVVLTGVSTWNTELASGGFLLSSHDDLGLTLKISQDQLDKLCKELASSHFDSIELTVFIESFRDPLKPHSLCIEEESDGSRAFLSRLSASRSVGIHEHQK